MTMRADADREAVEGGAPRPLEVTVVRPPATWKDFAHQQATAWPALFLAGLLVMLLMPYAIFGLEPGYWECVATVWVTRILFTRADSGFYNWTTRRDQKRRWG